MAGVFISYRRDDSAGYAGRLFDRLAMRFGADQVFLDVGRIRPGTDFVNAIEEAIASCDVILAVIGPRWASIEDLEGRRRIVQEEDLIRREIQTALDQRIPVLPLLVGGAKMPPSTDLPQEMVRLARFDALEVRDDRFDQDAQRLIEAIEDLRRTARAAEGIPARPVDGANETWDALESITRTRKIITVLAVHLLGVDDALSSDPEIVFRIEETRVHAIEAIVTRFGGAIEGLSGSRMLVYFGIPQAHEDDAERAARAALDLIRELDDVVGIGVATGEVVVDVRQGRSTADGAPVRSAETLAGLGPPRTVSISDATYRIIRYHAWVEPAGSAELGGGLAWHLLELGPDPSTALRMVSPFLGRDEELRLLYQAFERSARERGCHLFTVIGGAGVGKSRLMAEFLASVAERSTQLVGSCLAYGEGITFWPVAQIIRRAAGIEPTDTREELAGKVAAALTGSGDRDLVSARVLQVLGISESSSAPEEIFWAVRRLVEHVASRGPVIVVLEDIQWAEPTLLDLLDHLTDWSDGAPILVVCLARHELLDHRPAWGGGKRNATTIRLEPFSRVETEQLLDRSLGGDDSSSELRSQIASAAEGNPLFVEEMIGMLIYDGTLVYRDDRWMQVRDLSAIEVPPTISALLNARLDQLADEEREVIQRASVQGREFYRGAVEALSPPALRSRLAIELLQLVRSELIRPTPSMEIAGEDGFDFRHILIRDAAYGTLPKQLRAELHELFADWIERRAGDRAEEFEEITGYHLEQAFRYLDELEPHSRTALALASRAGEILARAGGRAHRRGDMPAAVNLLSRVVELLPSGDPRALRAMPALGEALFEIGELQRSDDVLDLASRGAGSIGALRLEAYASVVRSLLRILTAPTGWVDEARSAAERAMPLFEAAGDEAALAKAWELMHHVHVFHGRYAEAEAASARAAAHAEKAGQDLQHARHLAICAATSVFGPTPVDEGLRRCREALRIARDHPAVEAQVWLGMAGLEAMQGGFMQARALVTKARDRWADLGMRLSTASAVALYSGFVETLARDPAAAERELRSGMDALEQMGEQGVFSSIAATLARVVYQQGRRDEAAELVEISQHVAAPDDIDAQVQLRGVRARLLTDRGATAEGEDLAREALTLANQTDDLDLQRGALMDVAYVLQQGGQIDAAAEQISEAVDLCNRKGNRVAASSCRAALAELRGADSTP